MRRHRRRVSVAAFFEAAGPTRPLVVVSPSTSGGFSFPLLADHHPSYLDRPAESHAALLAFLGQVLPIF